MQTKDKDKESKPHIILTFTQLLRYPSPETGFTGARLVFVVFVSLNKPRTSGRRQTLRGSDATNSDLQIRSDSLQQSSCHEAC